MGKCISMRNAMMWDDFWPSFAERGYCIRFDAKALLACYRWCGGKFDLILSDSEIQIDIFCENAFEYYFFRIVFVPKPAGKSTDLPIFLCNEFVRKFVFLMKCETRTPKVRCHFVQLRVDKFRHFVGCARYIYFGVARRKCFRCGRDSLIGFSTFTTVSERRLKKSELFLPWRQIEWRACSPQSLAGPFYVGKIDQHWRKTEYGTNVPNELIAQTT